MNQDMCPRCGFNYGADVSLTEIKGWPEGISFPPLPSTAHPHPVGVCCSPFILGEQLWYCVDPDGPPAKVIFMELVGINAPSFDLKGTEWVQVSSRKAVTASVIVDPMSIQPWHEEHFGDKISSRFEVSINELTRLDFWPVLEVR